MNIRWELLLIIMNWEMYTYFPLHLPYYLLIETSSTESFSFFISLSKNSWWGTSKYLLKTSASSILGSFLPFSHSQIWWTSYLVPNFLFKSSTSSFISKLFFLEYCVNYSYSTLHESLLYTSLKYFVKFLYF